MTSNENLLCYPNEKITESGNNNSCRKEIQKKEIQKLAEEVEHTIINRGPKYSNSKDLLEAFTVGAAIPITRILGMSIGEIEEVHNNRGHLKVEDIVSLPKGQTGFNLTSWGNTTSITFSQDGDSLKVYFNGVDISDFFSLKNGQKDATIKTLIQHANFINKAKFSNIQPSSEELPKMFVVFVKFLERKGVYNNIVSSLNTN